MKRLKILIALLLLMATASASANTIIIRRAHPPAGGGGSGITLVQSDIINQTSAVTSQDFVFASDVTTGNLIGAAGVHSRLGVTVTCADTLGNSYTVTPASDNSGTTSAPFICWALSASTGANTLTVTFVGNTALHSTSIFEFNRAAGWDATPFDADVFTATPDDTTWTSNALTVAANNSLLLMVAGTLNINETYTAGACCVIMEQASASNKSSATQYRLDTPSGSNVPTITVSASNPGWLLAAAFK